jgi:hypothetical protein
MILCGLWTYFKLNFFHLDKTVKKGYNIYIISFQEKVLAPALVCSRAFFCGVGRSSIWPECPARGRKVACSNHAHPE